MSHESANLTLHRMRLRRIFELIVACGRRAAIAETDMQCPHCQHEFRLTWKRYWTAWTWKHTCPECKRTSQLNFPAVYIAFIAASFFVGISSARILVLAIFPGQYHSPAAHRFRLAFYVFFVLLVFVPIDRWFNNSVRRLVKI